MKHRFTRRITSVLLVAGALQIGVLTSAGQSSNIPVPGTANPWLADASSASSGDTAPAESPVLVQLVDLKAGDEITFSATGSVSYAGFTPTDPPDGDNGGGGFRSLYHLSDSANGGPENGIAGLNAPADALIGVFLGPNAPSPDSLPASFLNFAPNGNVPGNIDYTNLAPAIAQPFFIGDGLTSSGTPQRITVPAGATRLFLGAMDGTGWYNNTGSFSVSIALAFSAPPPPVAPANGGLSTTNFTVDGSYSATGNLADTTLRFAAQQAGTPAGLQVRVQTSTTPNVESSWSDLNDGNGGRLTYSDALQAFVLNSKAYPPQSGVFFRAVASGGGYPDSISNVVGPFDLTSSKAPLGSTRLDFTGNGNIADLYFRTTESATPSGISLRVQTSTTPNDEGSWSDLQNGNSGIMTQSTNPKQFLLLVNNYPTTQGIYFRAIATAPGYADSISNLMGPFDVTATVPPVVEVTVADQLSGSGDGHSPDSPILLSADSAGFAARVQSDRPVKTVQLQIDGHAVNEFPGNPNPNTLYVDFVNPLIGDHVYEAVAINDLGATARAGTGVIYVRVVPSQNAARIARAADSPAAATSTGHVFHVVNSGGDWTTASTWADENGQPGVPGLNDLAVVGSSHVTLHTPEGVGIQAGSVSLSSGGVIEGFGSLQVNKTITLFGGSFVNGATLVILDSATANLLNPQDINFGGRVANHGTFNVHGSGGFVGATEFDFTGTINWLPPIQIPANGGTDPLAAVRIVGAISFTGNGLITGTISPLITHDGATVISNDGHSLVGNSGGTIISTHGGGIVASGGGNIVASGGGNVISRDSAGIVATGGGNIVATGGGNFHSNGSTSVDAPTDSGFTQNGGETNLSACTIVGPVTLNGGTLSGTGFIQGNLTNNGGYITPGHSAGAVAVLGNFTQGSNGTTIIEAGGASGEQFDSLQVAGTASLGGKLDVKTINGFTPDPAQLFNPISYTSATGSLANSANISATVNATGITTTINPSLPNPSAGQPLNIATRLAIQGGDNVLIAGFIVIGPSGSTKKVLIRGMGPSLTNLGVAGAISDPLLELHEPDGTVVVNDDWQQGDTSQIPNGFAPSDSRESVIVATLTPGTYSALVKGAHGETGVGLAEVYDLESASTARLANVATRGLVQTGDNVLIGGFIIGGTEPTKVIVRAIGPSLAAFGVPNPLPATTLELHDANGSVISNDGWRSTQESEIIATTIPPTSDDEAAIVATLVPGTYTAVVRGKNDTTGIAVIEAYNLK
ncbi:MAG TPA: hypothetical protein VH188_01835 [Chthoniobacterales bacterium]|jgi:hypothetical protein|nr:hypothetical protein [Chthoniobacterales bacterium]